MPRYPYRKNILKTQNGHFFKCSVPACFCTLFDTCSHCENCHKTCIMHHNIDFVMHWKHKISQRSVFSEYWPFRNAIKSQCGHFQAIFCPFLTPLTPSLQPRVFQGFSKYGYFINVVPRPDICIEKGPKFLGSSGWPHYHV